jgi:hypothetical protein
MNKIQITAKTALKPNDIVYFPDDGKSIQGEVGYWKIADYHLRAYPFLKKTKKFSNTKRQLYGTNRAFLITDFDANVNEEQWPPKIKGVHNIEKGQKVKIKNTTKKGEIVDFDNTTADVKFTNGKIEKFPLIKLRFVFEQMPNAIGAEIGSEPTVHDKKFRFNFDSPYPVLPLDVARHIGVFLHVNFDKVTIEDWNEAIKTQADKMSERPKTIGDWIKIGKIAMKQNIGEGGMSKLETKLRKIIRDIIVETLKEAKASHNVKVYLKAGEKAPQGAKVSQGPQGGKYYYTRGAAQGGKHIGYPKKSDAKLRKFAKDAGLDPDHKDTVDDYEKTEDGKNNLAKHKDRFEKLDQHKKADFLKKLYPSEPDIEDLVYTQGTFRMSDPPESSSEMREANRMAKQYWKMLKKHPELEKLGFKEEDVSEF